MLEKGTKQWNVLHIIGKPMIRRAVNSVGKKYKKIMEKKVKEGFNNEEVKLLYKNFNEIIEMQKPVWRGPKDENWIMFHDLRDIVCALLDEDSYYLLRFFYLIEILHRDYEKYNIEMHKEKVYWKVRENNGRAEIQDLIRWPEIYAEIQRVKKENENENKRIQDLHNKPSDPDKRPS